MPSRWCLPPANPAPGASVLGTVTLGGPAPPPLVIPAGQTSATFSMIAGGAGLQAPAFTRLYVSDGNSSRSTRALM